MCVEMRGLQNKKMAWSLFEENYGGEISVAEKRALADIKPDKK
jgi:hypothetical protein